MNESPLVAYARDELQRAGMFDTDADYGGALAGSILRVVEVFAGEEHSGASAAISLAVLGKLLRFEPLTPITSDPAEWNDVSEASGRPMWQSRRKYSCFSTDGGQTWYDIDDPADLDKWKAAQA